MFGLAIHGGAGTLPRAEMSAESEALYRAGLAEALAAGFAVLERGGTSLDAVTRAVVVLEDCPLFNAGRGAVFTHDGQNELDASIMDGATRKAGAVCGVTHIKNPIELARAVMEHSDYVMLSRRRRGGVRPHPRLALVPRSYFLHGGALAPARAHTRAAKPGFRPSRSRTWAPWGRWLRMRRAAWPRPPRPAA